MSSLISNNGTLRYDLQVVASWITPGAKVLGLGCGDGDLLYHLKNSRQATCTGIEINEDRAARCIERGLTVLQGDISEEIRDYPDNVFDYVVCTLTLQQIYAPDNLIRDMLRVGNKGIVSFPNFSHWKTRLQLLLTGYAPVTPQLPYEWFDTPNIRVITLKDFRKFSRKAGFRILKEVAINTDNQDKRGNITRIFPDLRATYGIFLIGGDRSRA